MAHHVRIARPVRNIEETARLYADGLGLRELGSFRDHDGFDGVMLGEAGGGFHLEFTVCRTHLVEPTPTPEDLIVFYLPNEGEWAERCRQMAAAGFKRVPSLNPYWEVSGRTFEDSDGYRVVIQNSDWKSSTH